MIQTELEVVCILILSCCLMAFGGPCFAQEGDTPAPSHRHNA